MSILESVLWCLVPALRRKRRREREEAARAELLKRKTSQLCQVRGSRNYGSRKQKILGDISFFHTRTVVVWPRGDKGDIAEPPRTYGRQPSYVQDRWAVENGGGTAWRGVTLVFKTAQEAERAALDIPLKIKNVESVLLYSIVESLVDSELLHPEQKGRTSKVVIRREGGGGRPPSVPPPEEIDALHDALGAYGSLQTFFVHNGPTTLGWYCEATYPYVTQAYVAALLTEGRRLQGAGGGVYTAAVDTSDPRDGQILADARQCARTPFPPSWKRERGLQQDGAPLHIRCARDEMRARFSSEFDASK